MLLHRTNERIGSLNFSFFSVAVFFLLVFLFFYFIILWGGVILSLCQVFIRFETHRSFWIKLVELIKFSSKSSRKLMINSHESTLPSGQSKTIYGNRWPVPTDPRTSRVKIPVRYFLKRSGYIIWDLIKSGFNVNDDADRYLCFVLILNAFACT